MMAVNHRHQRAWITSRRYMGGWTGKDIFRNEVGLTGLVQQTVQIVASHDLTLLVEVVEKLNFKKQNYNEQKSTS